MKIALLGGNGMIGQAYHRLAHAHPWFSIVNTQNVEEASRYPVVFTALPNSVAGNIEQALVTRGCKVISSAAHHRLIESVPLLIPEVNPEAVLSLASDKGWIVTKPNCTVHTFVLPLAPLHAAFKITALAITSMQALSGGGKQALSDPRLASQVATYIPEEEEKCINEPKKIWRDPSLIISAQCNRVPVLHGHVVSLSVKFRHKPSKTEILECWESYSPLTLPSSPHPLITYHEDDLPPLPTNGMTVQCARLTPCPHFDFRFIAAAHNVVRGGAGGGLLIAEYLYQKGYLA